MSRDRLKLVRRIRSASGSILNFSSARREVMLLQVLTADERDFETVAQHVREAIEKNQPEAALDRLHTFVIKYLRTVCAHRGVEINRDKALHSIFGEYVKRLRDAGLVSPRG